jgi:excisionase family DNA binding protein
MSDFDLKGSSPKLLDSALVNSANDVLLTADEVAAILRVPRSWVYGHLDLLPTVRLGRYVRFRRIEVELFLERKGTCG